MIASCFAFHNQKLEITPPEYTALNEKHNLNPEGAHHEHIPRLDQAVSVFIGRCGLSEVGVLSPVGDALWLQYFVLCEALIGQSI